MLLARIYAQKKTPSLAMAELAVEKYKWGTFYFFGVGLVHSIREGGPD